MTVVVNVLRIAEPPLPATLAIIRAVAPDTVVVVDPTMTADDLRERFYDRYVGDEAR